MKKLVFTNDERDMRTDKQLMEDLEHFVLDSDSIFFYTTNGSVAVYLEVNDDNYFGKHTFYKGTVPVLRPTFLDLYDEFGEQFQLRLRNDLSLKPIKEKILYGE